MSLSHQFETQVIKLHVCLAEVVPTEVASLRERERDRQTDRQTDRQHNRQTETDRQTAQLGVIKAKCSDVNGRIWTAKDCVTHYTTESGPRWKVAGRLYIFVCYLCMYSVNMYEQSSVNAFASISCLPGPPPSPCLSYPFPSRTPAHFPGEVMKTLCAARVLMLCTSQQDVDCRNQ